MRQILQDLKNLKDNRKSRITARTADHDKPKGFVHDIAAYLRSLNHTPSALPIPISNLGYQEDWDARRAGQNMCSSAAAIVVLTDMPFGQSLF